MTPSNAELREAIEALQHKSRMVLYTDTIQGEQTRRDDLWAVSTKELEDLLALFQAREQQLLAELLGEAENFVLVDASPTDVEIIGSERAVPVSVIEQKLKELTSRTASKEEK